MDIKRLRRNAQQTLRIADTEDWSETDASRILANDALVAADAIEGLLAALQSFVRFHHNDTDTTIVTLCDEARAAIAAAKEK